jgi:hypothetical protein
MKDFLLTAWNVVCLAEHIINMKKYKEHIINIYKYKVLTFDWY